MFNLACKPLVQPTYATYFTNFQPIVGLLVCKSKKQVIISYKNLLIAANKNYMKEFPTWTKNCLLEALIELYLNQTSIAHFSIHSLETTFFFRFSFFARVTPKFWLGLLLIAKSA